MIKALFLDMDETLCDTYKANQKAKELMCLSIKKQFGSTLDHQAIANAYVSGIYREWSDEQRERYQPIIEKQSESAFRVQLILDLLINQGEKDIRENFALTLQKQFDRNRLAAFDFYSGIKDFLAEARKLFTLVVITNGPEFSQIPKVEAVELIKHVDHIIIGGQEPEEKPAPSIFTKAMKLANCSANEAVHIGDSLITDIAGANNSGITSVWIQHQQAFDTKLDINPNYSLLHPCEIPTLIRTICKQ
jgi:HAD superfamily hydrolase (TIGR01549 family)